MQVLGGVPLIRNLGIRPSHLMQHIKEKVLGAILIKTNLEDSVFKIDNQIFSMFLLLANIKQWKKSPYINFPILYPTTLPDLGG